MKYLLIALLFVGCVTDPENKAEEDKILTQDTNEKLAYECRNAIYLHREVNSKTVVTILCDSVIIKNKSEYYE